MKRKRDSYLGGHSKIWLGSNGTIWETSDKSHLQKPKTYERFSDNDADDADEVERLGRLDRSFILQCAMAYARRSLTDTSPRVPSRLKREVRSAGGIAKWLGVSEGRRLVFLARVQEILKRKIPYQEIWED